jgi:hypothetical protein
VAKKTKIIRKSAGDGRFVSKKYEKSHPGTTYKQKVKTK